MTFVRLKLFFDWVYREMKREGMSRLVTEITLCLLYLICGLASHKTDDCRKASILLSLIASSTSLGSGQGSG